MRIFLSTLLVVGLFANSAYAQTAAPSLESIEAQIKAKEEAAARAAQQAKQAAAARQADATRNAELARQQEMARMEQARRDADSAPATLIVQSDADCSLTLDGKPRAQLVAGLVESLQVQPGEQLIRCVSLEDASHAVELVKQVDGGAKLVVNLELAALLPIKIDLGKAGTVFHDQLKDKSDAPDLVVLSSGSFMMGASDSEANREPDEGPQREVQIAAFAMGSSEITVAQFRQFVESSGYLTDAESNSNVSTMAGPEAGCFTFQSGAAFGWTAGSSWQKPGFAPGDSHPAVCISWNDAQAYADWLSSQTGNSYRLPSEAEHEYALRAGGNSRYAWGNDADAACTYANVLDQSAMQTFPGAPTVSCNDAYIYTSPVRTFKANAFGLYDMAGNAWEWTADCSKPNYQGAPTDARAWTGGDCGNRVLRGAGWNGKPLNLRAANRLRDSRALRAADTGFRVARDL